MIKGKTIVLLATLVAISLGGCAHSKNKKCDLNGDGKDSHADFEAFQNAFGKSQGTQGYNPRADFNKNGIVQGDDFAAYVDTCGEGVDDNG